MNFQFVSAIVRHILSALGGYLVTAGWLQNGQLEQFIGAGLFIVSFVWSIVNKWRAEKTIDTALELKAGSSRDALNKEMKL
jgi:hypothetical protein